MFDVIDVWLYAYTLLNNVLPTFVSHTPPPPPHFHLATNDTCMNSPNTTHMYQQ